MSSPGIASIMPTGRRWTTSTALYQSESGSKGRSAEENAKNRAQDPARPVLGYGGSYSIRGTPDRVAGELKRLHDAGFSGVAIGLGELSR